MFSFVRKNTDEIRASRTLRLYGFFLFIPHVATWFFWNWGFPLDERLASGADCWPFFPSCDLIRPSILPWVMPTQWLYLIFSILGALLFLKRRTVTAGWWILLAVSAYKLLVTAQDYRFMGNYHYIPNFMNLLFLFVPGKILAARWFLVVIYVSAGLLKFNSEWLTGRAYFREILLPGALVPFASLLAVVLEMFVSFFLLSRNRVLFGLALASFVAFHVFSYHLVGFFYPVVMLSLLSIFALAWWLRELPPAESEWSMRGFGFRARAVFCLGLILLQAVPLLSPGDPALTGQGRTFALNMFDSFSRCEPLVLREREREWVDFSEKRNDVGVRIHCDPILYLGQARQLCREPGTEVTLGLVSKRSGEQIQHLIALEPQTCQKKLSFHLFLSNDWIRSTPLDPFARR